MLEGVQRTFTHRIAEFKQSNYWERLKEMHLMSLQRRRERYIILYVWKILHNVSPNDIGMTFRKSTRNGTVAVVPPLTKGSSQRNQSLYDSSFAVQGPRLWNTIPTHIKALDKFVTFKESLSVFLSRFPDEPPTQGYTCSNSNSIVDWAGSRRL